MGFRLAALTAGLALALAGCGLQSPPAPPGPATSVPVTPAPTTSAPGTPESRPFTLAGLPRIDGSTANIPLISLAIQRLTGATSTEADNAVNTSGTPTAWRNLVAGNADLLVVYEPDETVNAEVMASGVELESYPIGRDALVFFTNSSNPVTSLTTQQYHDIYSGAIANWSQVGGEDAEIIAYQRPQESGSQALMRKYVMGETAMAPAPTERITGDMGGIIEGVASYANTGNALGYSVYYYLANMYAVEGIRMLAVDGVVPSGQSIGDGTYPYANDFYAVVRADEPDGSPARRVLEWLLGEDGRQAVADAGYVPAP